MCDCNFKLHKTKNAQCYARNALYYKSWDFIACQSVFVNIANAFFVVVVNESLCIFIELELRKKERKKEEGKNHFSKVQFIINWICACIQDNIVRCCTIRCMSIYFPLCNIIFTVCSHDEIVNIIYDNLSQWNCLFA